MKTMHASSALSHSIQNTSSHGNAFYSISFSPRWSSGGSGEPASYWSADRKASRGRTFSLLTCFSISFGISGIIQAKIAVKPNWHNLLFKVTRKQIRNTAYMLGYICVLFEATKDCDYYTSQLHHFGLFTWLDTMKDLVCHARLLIFSHCCTT